MLINVLNSPYYFVTITEFEIILVTSLIIFLDINAMLLLMKANLGHC